MVTPPSAAPTRPLRTVLAIESSCDETAAAVLRDGREVLASVVASQIEMHRAYGGVVPELAFRKHLELLPPVLTTTLERAGLSWHDLDGIAVSHGPGLVGALLVGVSSAKVIAGLLGCPLRGVNHLEAHVYANFLQHDDIEFPLVCLLVSGGHTLLLHMAGHGVYRFLGETRDDAAGEAFDKVARCLGLGYPGGPVVDRLAQSGNPRAVSFPRAWMGADSLEFSFSGLKTAVIGYLERHGIPAPRTPEGAAACNEQTWAPSSASISLEDVCASFQAAVVEVLVAKTIRAAQQAEVQTVLMAGGVACNRALQAKMQEACCEAGLTLRYPRPGLCTDNAMMVACAGYHQLRAGLSSPLELDCYPVLAVGSGW